MSLSLLLSMSVFALAASISPGPVNVVCLSTGTRYSIGKGLIFVTGASLGFIVLFLATGIGLYSVLTTIPWLADIVRWAGVAFLLYLSFKLARDNGHLPQQEQHNAPGFMTGVLMQWLNPKAWLASVSGIGTYTSSHDSQQLIIFATVYLPICWLSLSSWVYAGAFLRKYIQKPLVLVTLNRVLAVLLASSCIYLIIE